jgi:hypothetical protein
VSPVGLFLHITELVSQLRGLVSPTGWFQQNIVVVGLYL